MPTGRLSVVPRLTAALWAMAPLLLDACGTEPPPAFHNVSVKVTITGNGRVYAPASAVNIDATNPPSSSDSTGFTDAGGGGVFDLVAEPATGWQLGSWGGDCSGTTGTTCTLSFSAGEGPVFNATATFTAPPSSGVVLQDDFEGGCGQWTATVSGTSTGMASETCWSPGSDGGMFLEMTHRLPDVSNQVVDHAFTGGSVMVGGSEMCAASVRFEEQRKVTGPAFPGAGVGAWVWVRQDGVRHDGPSIAFSNTVWEAYDSGPLTAADFTGSLDLCPATATTLTFGFNRSNSNTGGGNVVNIHGIDEWKVTVSP